LGRGYTYAVFFAIEIVAFWQLAQVSSMMAFETLIFLIITCYGGGFSCMPAYLSDIFGTRQLSAIHGRILTAWGIAGVVGPFLVSWLRESTNSYSITLYFFSVCFILNLIIALVLKYKGKKLQSGNLAKIKEKMIKAL
jgi:OFA family oxalate/formate antiporter-like MFS transporter